MLCLPSPWCGTRTCSVAHRAWPWRNCKASFNELPARGKWTLLRDRFPERIRRHSPTLSTLRGCRCKKYWILQSRGRIIRPGGVLAPRRQIGELGVAGCGLFLLCVRAVAVCCNTATARTLNQANQRRLQQFMETCVSSTLTSSSHGRYGVRVKQRIRVRGIGVDSSE